MAWLDDQWFSLISMERDCWLAQRIFGFCQIFSVIQYLIESNYFVHFEFPTELSPSPSIDLLYAKTKLTDNYRQTANKSPINLKIDFHHMECVLSSISGDWEFSIDFDVSMS